MSNTYSKLMYHCIWSTKQRHPFITQTFEQRIHKIIAQIVEEEGGFLCCIGGMPDHIHILFSIKPSDSISRFIRNVKSSSSKMIRQLHMDTEKFLWQRGYGIFSVSTSQINIVDNYIQSQVKHHKKLSFEEEFKLLLERNGIEYDTQYLYG